MVVNFSYHPDFARQYSMKSYSVNEYEFPRYWFQWLSNHLQGSEVDKFRNQHKLHMEEIVSFLYVSNDFIGFVLSLQYFIL